MRGPLLSMLALGAALGSAQVVQRKDGSKKQRPESDAFNLPDAAQIAAMWMQTFDKDKNGLLDGDEIASWIATNEQMDKSSDSSSKEADVESKIKGMMSMLDENVDGHATMSEVVAFAQKMHDMDGRTDRLPGTDNGGDTQKRRKKKKKKKRPRATEEHDEL